jgi:glucan 1,3-beta-glucosidase
MGLYQRISGSSNLNIYSSGFWNFVAGPSRSYCSTDCQDNAALFDSNSKMHVYGFSTINSKNLILESGVAGNTAQPVAVGMRTANSGSLHDGFKTGVIAAYLRQST